MKKNTSGYALIIGVIIMSSAFMLIVVLGAKSIQYNTVIIQEQIDQSGADLLADSCAQNVLRKIVDDPTYAGNEVLNTDEGDCTIFPIVSGLPATLDIQTTIGSHTTRLRITLDSKSPPNVTKWEQRNAF